jgi:high-affinity Fe2+/Pb2+ permease
MNAQPANQNDPQSKIELRIRTMRTLWIALFISIALYYALTFFVKPSPNATPNNMLFLILVVVALSMTLISFVIKNRLISRAVEQREPQLVQQAYIVALALTEVAALLGLLYFFMTGDRYYPVLFLIGACGQLLHFPRREHVMNAWPTSPIL